MNTDYTEAQLIDAVTDLLRRRRLLHVVSHGKAAGVSLTVYKRRHRPSLDDAAVIVVERCLTSARRLGHGTGATNWC